MDPIRVRSFLSRPGVTKAFFGLGALLLVLNVVLLINEDGSIAGPVGGIVVTVCVMIPPGIRIAAHHFATRERSDA
jgi:hypothetical protein